MKVFNGLKVILKETGQSGIIDGTFGQSGKIKVRMEEPIDEAVDLQKLVNSQIELHYTKNMMKR